MATRTPGGSSSFPNGQARQQFGRDWGNYASATTLPNASGNILTAKQFTLEAGDRAYLIVSGTSGLEYLCVSAGTAGGGDAVWIVTSGGLGPWSSVLYVDNVRGNDATGTRGDDNLPFATIQAALNAMHQFDTVELAPQLFSLTVTLTVPATVVNGTCVGAPTSYAPFLSFSGSTGGTAISSFTVALWTFGANLGLSGFVLANMALFSTSTVISADGSAYAKDAFFANGLYVVGCNIALGQINTKYAGTYRAIRCVVVGSAITHVNGRVADYWDCYCPNPSLLASYDATDPLAATNAQTLSILDGSVVGGADNNACVTLTGQCHLVIDQTATIGGLKGASLSVSGAKAPSILCSGFVMGSNSSVLDFASAGAELPDTATVLTWNFKGTRFYGNNGLNTNGPTAIRFKVVGATPTNFQTVVLDSSMTTPGCTLTADTKIHLTGRGALWPTSTLTTPGTDGDIVPPPFTTGPTALASIAQAVSFGFRMPGSTYMVAPDLDDSTAVYQSVSPRTTTGFTVNVAVPAGNFRGLVTYMG